MKTENLHCDYCGKTTTYMGVAKEPLHGFVVELGYSKGGWGERRDFVSEHKVELCTDCFGIVRDKSILLADAISFCRMKGKHR